MNDFSTGPDATAGGRASDRDVAQGELADALTVEDPISPGVRAAVRRYVAAARAAGVPPERVLSGLKQVLGLHASRLAETHRARDSEPTATAQIVRWAIDDYYRAD